MPNPAWDNVDEFLDPADFGTVAHFLPATGPEFDLPCIFDDGVMNVEAGEYDMADARTRIEVNELYTPRLKKRDRVVVYGVLYYLVHDPHPNGTGTCVLEISRDF